MMLVAGRRWVATLVALSGALMLSGVVHAQAQEQQGATNDSGVVTGEVARCIDGVEKPAISISVGVEGGARKLATTDDTGGFFLALPAGSYTVIASADDGSSASRQYVPVESGAVLDIGILDLGGGLAGCVPDAVITEPAGLTPTPNVTPAVPTPAPLPQDAPAPAA